MQAKTRLRALTIFLVVIGLFAALAVASLLRSAASGAAQATATFGPIIGGPTSGPTAIPTTGSTPTSTPSATANATAPAAATVNVTATPLPTLKTDFMGIQAYAYLGPDQWAGIMDRARFMGFKWIKIQLTWKEAEPVKGQFSQQFTIIKDAAFQAGRWGFNVMLSIAKAPDWARPANARGQNDGPPANPQDLADFVGTVFDQFNLEHLKAVEIWNEPNNAGEWTGAPLDGKTYMKYFDAAYKAVRARSQDMTIITAGAAPGSGGGLEDDRQWLQELYSSGLLNKSDPNLAIGVHPYGWANPPEARCCAPQDARKGWDDNRAFFFLDTIYDFHDIMVKNGHSQGKLWATEFGWATFQGLHFKDHVQGPTAMPPADPNLAWMTRLTEQQQATYAVRAFQLAQSGDLAGFMGPMFLWNENFATLPGYVNADKPSLPEAGYSVLDVDWNTRPIYLLIQAAPKQ